MHWEKSLCSKCYHISGHGFEFHGDDISVIPEFPEDGAEEKIARFINISGLARKFAGVKNTLNIFLLS